MVDGLLSVSMTGGILFQIAASAKKVEKIFFILSPTVPPKLRAKQRQ